MTPDDNNYDYAAGPGKFEGNMFRRAAAYAYADKVREIAERAHEESNRFSRIRRGLDG